jgi:RNA polymerase sigma factor (sigma-70 family)
LDRLPIGADTPATMPTSAAVARRSADRTTAYDQHRPYVLAVLSRRCRWLADDEREALLHDAWAIMLEKERTGVLDVAAMSAEQVRAYVTQTALNRALDEGRRARTRDAPLDEGAEVAAPAVSLHEVVDAGVEADRLREIVSELTPRQQTIVKLRFFFDRSPREVQALLGLTERAYRRDLERALALVAERFALVREGGFCESRASLIRAFVAGVAGPGRMQQARDHLATCPACRHYALQLRSATGRVAGVAPMPAFTLEHERLSGVADAIAAAKDHVLSLGTRVDPSSPAALAAARPGAVAAAVGACLAIGGGATYCVVDGLPGFGQAPRDGAHERVLRRPPRAALATPSVTIPASPPSQARRPDPVAASATTTTPTRTTAKATKKAEDETKTPSSASSASSPTAEAGDHEFGFETQPDAAPAQTVAPARKPTAADREFGP